MAPRRRFQRLVGALLVLGATAASAVDSPAPAEDPKIPFTRYQLANGLEVILVEDHSVPLVAVDVWYHVGSGDEVPGKSGYAHLFEHMMFQGTRNTGEDRHFAILREAGASDVNGSTDFARTNYYEVVPANQVETALWLESERMGYLPEAITETSLANQREVVRNERRQSYDNVAYGKERLAINELLYPEGHPYRHLVVGRHEDLAAASVDDVKGFFAKWYAPANATLVLAGDLTAARARELVEKWFGSFPSIPRPVRVVVPTPSVQGPQRRTVEDPFVKVRRVHYAWHSPALYAPGDAELDVVASTLGRAGTGRLYKTLVLERQWATSVLVYQSSQQLSSTFDVIVDLEDDADLAAVEKIIDDELVRVAREPIDERELRRAVVRYESAYWWGLESLLNRAEQLQSYNHYTGDPGYFSRDLDRYRHATLETVRAAAAHLRHEARVEVITLPATSSPPESQAATAGASASPADRAPGPGKETASRVSSARPAFPRESFRAHQPKAGPEPRLVPPGVDHFTLGSGIDVFLVERHTLPTIALDIAFQSGAIDDPPGKEGLAALCMDLLDDGTTTLDKVAFEEAQADLASRVSAWSASEQEGVSATTLARNLGRTLDLWADTLLRPGLRDGDHARNLARHLAGLRQSKGAPATIGRRITLPIFFGAAHPFGRLSTEASLAAVSAADCRSYLGAHLRPRGAQLYVVGDVSRSRLEQEVGRRLASWTGASAPSVAVGPPAPQPIALYFVDVPGAAQSYVAMAEPGPLVQAPDYAATSVMVGILGGEFSSRINFNLREKKGWSYGAGAGFRYTQTTGLFRATASVRTDATKGAVLELFGEIARMAASGAVTADELERERNGEARALPALFATGDDILSTYRNLIRLGLPLDFYATLGDRLHAVNAKAVAVAARDHLAPDRLSVVVVGDGAVVLPGLEEIVASRAVPGLRELVRLDADAKPVATPAAH